jgi:hypothetical protein
VWAMKPSAAPKLTRIATSAMRMTSPTTEVLPCGWSSLWERL